MQKTTLPLIRLAAGVELLSGPDDVTLLYVSARKSYLRLSATGAAMIRLLQERCAATPPELWHSLSGNDAAAAPQPPQQFTQFLARLNEAGVLEANANNPAPPPSLLQRIGQKITAKPRLELPLWRPNRPLGAAALKTVQAQCGHFLGRLLALFMLLSLATIFYTASAPRPAVAYSGSFVLLLAGLLLLHTVGHELAHAFVSSYYGVKVREIGVALLYYFLPVAYTDRTDAYRLRHFRSRAYIALAGPGFDLLATAFSAVLANVASGPVATTFRALMWLQLAGFVTTLNPLLPGDGCHALEAWFGALNFRGRAFTLFWRRLTGRALPPHLQTLTTRQQWFHFGYAALSSLYVVLLAWGVLNFAIIKVMATTK